MMPRRNQLQPETAVLQGSGIFAAVCAGERDICSLSEQEKQVYREECLAILESSNEEEVLPPLSSWPLQTALGREQFLRQFAWVGEEALFEAVAHVWDSLAEPRKLRSTRMGIAARSGGAGRHASPSSFSSFSRNTWR